MSSFKINFAALSPVLSRLALDPPDNDTVISESEGMNKLRIFITVLWVGDKWHPTQRITLYTSTLNCWLNMPVLSISGLILDTALLPVKQHCSHIFAV